MENTTQKQDKRRFILILALVVLVVLNVLLIYLIMQKKNSEIAQREEVIEQQKTSYEKDLKNLEERLKYQIKKAKRMGDENQTFIDSLQTVLGQIEEDRDKLKNSLKITQDQMRQYQQKIDAYEILLRKKDQELDKLRETNEILYGENRNLKEEKNELTSEITEIQEEREKLSNKVAQAGVLKAENVNVNIIDNRGKERSGGQYRANKIEKLLITFNVADNKVAKIGNKDIYMRLLEPSGTVLANPGSYGTFDIDGKEMTYSARQQILFDNSRQQVRFQFDRSGEYKPGRHTVEFYSEGYRIGYGTFDVR